MREIEVEGGEIRLGQLLKVADLAASGGAARALIQGGEVRVNGEVELRRGRRLRSGDVVTAEGEEVRVA